VSSDHIRSSLAPHDGQDAQASQAARRRATAPAPSTLPLRTTLESAASRSVRRCFDRRTREWLVAPIGLLLVVRSGHAGQFGETRGYADASESI